MKHVDEMRTKDKNEGQRTGLCKGSWCHRTTLTVMSSYVSQSSFVANRHVYEGDPRHFPEAIWTSLEPNTKRNLQITIRNLGEEKKRRSDSSGWFYRWWRNTPHAAYTDPPKEKRRKILVKNNAGDTEQLASQPSRPTHPQPSPNDQ